MLETRPAGSVLPSTREAARRTHGLAVVEKAFALLRRRAHHENIGEIDI